MGEYTIGKWKPVMDEASMVPVGVYPKGELYDRLKEAARSLLGPERDAVANAANLAALLYHGMPDLNWRNCLPG